MAPARKTKIPKDLLTIPQLRRKAQELGTPIPEKALRLALKLGDVRSFGARGSWPLYVVEVLRTREALSQETVWDFFLGGIPDTAPPPLLPQGE